MNDKPKTAEATFFHPDLLEIPEDGRAPYLKGYRCTKCGQIDFPKLNPCPNCWGETFEVVPLSRTGRLYSVTEIFVGQAGLQTPYAFGYVDLPEDLRIFARVEGPPGSFQCDDMVELFVGTIRTNKDGQPLKSYMFRKVAASASPVRDETVEACDAAE